MTEGPEDTHAPKLGRIERGVEERLRDLVEAGELAGLPGEGAPLRDDDRVLDDGWAARHVMRTAGATPVWVQLRREIDERRAALRRRYRAHHRWLHDRARLLAELPADRILDASRATAARDVRVRQELALALSETNALIRRYDLLVVPSLQLPLVSLERIADEGA